MPLLRSSRIPSSTVATNIPLLAELRDFLLSRYDISLLAELRDFPLSRYQHLAPSGAVKIRLRPNPCLKVLVLAEWKGLPPVELKFVGVTVFVKLLKGLGERLDHVC